MGTVLEGIDSPIRSGIPSEPELQNCARIEANPSCHKAALALNSKPSNGSDHQRTLADGRDSSHAGTIDFPVEKMDVLTGMGCKTRIVSYHAQCRPVAM